MSDLTDRMQKYTKSTPQRMQAMIDAVSYIDDEKIAGDVAECGVWRGGNIIIARTLSPRRICWLYDTFMGMPPQATVYDRTFSGRRMDKPGKDAVPIAEIIVYMVEAGVYDERYLRFIEGPVEVTLHDEKNLSDKLALLRLDTDWYESTKIELEVLWPRLVPGGIMIIDDYGHWMGCKKAVDEYFEGHPPSMMKIDYTCRMIVKPHV